MKTMMKKECRNMTPSEWMDLCKNYRQIYVDLGTGEGEYAFRQSQKNSDVLYVGIDACQEVMSEYAIKSEKRAKKQSIRNLVYVVATAEALPEELTGIADKITIHLPWGSLRDGLVKGCPVLLSNIRKIARLGATIDICITYSSDIEESMMIKRELPALTPSYVKETLQNLYRPFGIEIKKTQVLSNRDLIKLDTKWAKKLGYGKMRESFLLSCIVKA